MAARYLLELQCYPNEFVKYIAKDGSSSAWFQSSGKPVTDAKMGSPVLVPTYRQATDDVSVTLVSLPQGDNVI
jgi:hypothetical protein